MLQRVRESDLARALSLVRHKRWAYSLSVLGYALVLSLCFDIVLAFIVRDMLDAAVAREHALLLRAVAIAAGSLAAGLPLLLLCRYGAARSARKTTTGVRMRLFEHLQDLPVSSLKRGHSGDLVSRCTNDVAAMEEVYGDQMLDLAAAIVLGLVAMAAILFIEWRLGLLVLLLGAIRIYVNTTFARPLRRVSQAVQCRLGKLTERLTDLLASLPVAKIFHLEGVIHGLYLQENEDLSRAATARARTEAGFYVLDSLLDNLRWFGILPLGLLLVMRGSVEVGTVVAVIHLEGSANRLFGGIGKLIAGLQRGLAGAGRVFELLDRPAEPERALCAFLEQRQAATVAQADAMIEVRNLAFGYDADAAGDPGDGTGAGSGVPVLKGINLSVRRGQIAALVGPSGAGKSTLVQLLMGFYPPDAGTIYVDGKPMGACSLHELRGQIAYVPQDAYLFDGTIEENIRYGRPGATKSEIVRAARAAHAHEFVLEQPDGYATVVGERGARLSGGERQRIAIARALLKDAPILLLDEATSALDSESERLVRDALSALMAGRTTIAVAHRLSTAARADTILVLDGGSIVERGTHDELIARKGLYAGLCELQFQHPSPRRRVD